MSAPIPQMDPATIMKAFVDVLTVEEIEQNFYRGIATPHGRGRSFGGQVIAQALSAATATVPEDRPVHSLHGYFIRPGDATKPVLYQVERDRDGGSFTTRRVVAVQHGAPILNLSASFQRQEDGFSHQDQMPDVPPPEDLPTDAELAETLGDDTPDILRKWLSSPRPIETRMQYPRAPFDRSPRAPVQNMWVRAIGQLPDDPALHRSALAYVSDFGFLGTSVMPYGKTFTDADMQFASLDHALWLHADFRVDDWFLYAMDSPWAGGARGFNRGRIFTRDGKLVGNVAQEGLVRHIVPKT